MFDFTNEKLIFAFQNQSKREYLNYLDKLKFFVKDDQWLTMLSIDGIVNKRLNEYIVDVIDQIDVNELSAEKLNELILKIRNDIKNLVNNLEQNNYDVDEKYFLSREIYSMYGLIEVITEGSIITDKIFELFRKKYGENYLKVLKTIDNKNPSELTRFDVNSNDEVNIDFNSEEIKLYLLMKSWQDSQHIFHENELIKRHNLYKTRFEEFAKNKYPYLSNVAGLPLYCLYVLNESPILELEQVEKFLNTWFYKKLALVVGGKNLGLAILDYNGVNIPLTYVIPVASVANNAYVSELEKLPDINYAVRSSATVEDNENQSFAGLFVSKLDVDKKEIIHAGNEVYQSVYSDRVTSYVEHFQTEKPYMSIVLQQFREPKYAGVWLGDSLESGHMEWTKGNGEKLVSGRVKPSHEYWNNNSAKDDNVLKVNNEIVGQVCLKLQKKLNSISDFEFCVLNDCLYFVQFRPVTKKINQHQKVEISKNSISGVPASFGYVIGHPVYLEDVEDCSQFKNGDILLTDFTDPKWVPIMMKASAIVTAEGGFLSHTAIISRELGIPCITGVGYSNIEKISAYDKIVVDGTNGIINLNVNKKIMKKK